jgi:hypothetical protein
MVRVGEAVPQPPHGTPAVVREGPEAQVRVRRRADREFLDDHEEGAVGAERRADRVGRISIGGGPAIGNSDGCGPG